MSQNISFERNRTYFGDCLDLMRLIPDESIDMILADLPYGTTNCKWDTIIDLDELWMCYNRIIKPNGAILLFAQTPFDKVLGSSNLKMLKYEWIWEKISGTGHFNAKKAPLKAHENILVFYKKPPTYNYQKTTGHIRKTSLKVRSNNSDCYGNNTRDNFYDSTDRYPRSVLKYSSDKQRINLHPTQKPLALCEYLIKTYSNEGDLVLDNCSGSGTTGIAAKNLNRDFIMIENNIKNYLISAKRVKNK